MGMVWGEGSNNFRLKSFRIAKSSKTTVQEEVPDIPFKNAFQLLSA
jgi:hypothetical protein